MTEHAYGPECLKSGEETCLHENIKVDNGKKNKVKAMKLFVKVKWLHERRNTVKDGFSMCKGDQCVCRLVM